MIPPLVDWLERRPCGPALVLVLLMLTFAGGAVVGAMASMWMELGRCLIGSIR